MSADRQDLTLTINGRRRRVAIDGHETLLTVQREQLALAGAKRGCNQGVCGSCTVSVDGWPVRGCLSLAVNCVGRDITTIEGVAKGDQLSPVQQAFVDHGAAQCGFCMPGMIVQADWLVANNAQLTREEARRGLEGNLCRCTGYTKVLDAVESVVEKQCCRQG